MRLGPAVVAIIQMHSPHRVQKLAFPIVLPGAVASRINPFRLALDRSRPARPAVPTASANTTSSFASRNNSANPPNTSASSPSTSSSTHQTGGSHIAPARPLLSFCFCSSFRFCSSFWRSPHASSFWRNQNLCISPLLLFVLAKCRVPQVSILRPGVFSSPHTTVIPTEATQNYRHPDRSNGRSHRPLRSGGTPAFRLCCCLFLLHPERP